MLAVHRLGVYRVTVKPGSWAPVSALASASASLMLRATVFHVPGLYTGRTQQHRSHRPAGDGLAPARAAHAVSGGPHTPSLMHSLGKVGAQGQDVSPGLSPGREGTQVCCRQGEGERRGSEVPGAASDTQTLAVLLNLRISCVKTDDSA